MVSENASPARKPASFGATNTGDDSTLFRAWAPKSRQLSVQIIELQDGSERILRSFELKSVGNGVFEGQVDDCPAGTLYRYQLDSNNSRPDPYSRFQPHGVHGPSQVVNPRSYEWKDDNWQGVSKKNLVIYELHIGSFTDGGTYHAAIGKLDELVELGITAIELMPLTQSPGRWNWGYDGVNFFAPRNTYGSPDDLKRFVDECHRRGIAVIIDVVYNHVGPEGNYLNEFGPYRSTKFGTPWGDALNFCGQENRNVREFVIANVLFWVDEYHFDGLRLDAIHFMFDDSEFAIIDEIQQRCRAYASTQNRQLHLIGEANIYDSHLVGNPAAGHTHYDAIWSDCLMHCIYTHGNPELRLTDRKYRATDLPIALDNAFIFAAPNAVRMHGNQSNKQPATGDRRYIESLIMALQTHDSVGNHPHGARLHQLTSFHFQKAAAPLILLYPSIPMIFMGEEWATESPFPFFADFEDPRLRKAVDKGRRKEYGQHDWTDSPLPCDPRAFTTTKSEPQHQKQEMWDWYQSILQLRKRGRSEGWLFIENWSTECSPADDRFSLIYRTATGRIVVCCRLAKPDSEPLSLSFDNDVEVLLDSHQLEGTTTRHIELQAQHCCIWRQ